MGEVNCKCEEVSIDDLDFRYTSSRQLPKYSLPSLTDSRSPSSKTLLTRITLKNSKLTQHICLNQQESLVVGTTAECQHRWTNAGGNAFAMTMRMRERALMVRDLGTGLGVFVGKKKVTLKTNSEEYLVSLQDYFLSLKLSEKKIIWTTLRPDDQRTQEASAESNVSIKVEDIRLHLHRESSGEEYTLRRQDRKWMFVLLGTEERVKINQVLRLGMEYFTVEGIFTCVSAHLY